MPRPDLRPRRGTRDALVTAVALALVASLGPLARPTEGADPVYRAWQLQRVQTKDAYHPGGAVSRGTIVIEGFEATAQGGQLRLTAKRPNQCPPGAGVPVGGEIQRFRFSWRFAQDVSVISAGRGRIGVNFQIEGDRGNPCMDLNPIMALQADGDPFTQSPAGRFYFRPNPDHDPSPRWVMAQREESWRREALFQITIGDFRHDAGGGFFLTIIYPYQGIAAAAPPPPGVDPRAQALVARASKDPRFGAANPASFGANPGWSPEWELSWLQFGFAGGRVVQVYLATSKANPATRFVIFYDPDANRWTGWEPA